MTVLKMTDLDLAGKRVLIREDLNVPVKDGVVKSDARILASLPTIKLALEKGAAVMVCSHLGRPTEGEFSEENSLAPVAAYLSKALGREVPLVKDYLGGVEVKAGDIVLFENVRFNKGEKKNADELAQQYAALCDVFVMDAFGTAHRAEGSTHGVAKFAKVACAGPLLAAELARAATLLQEHGTAFRQLVRQLLADGAVPAATFGQVTGLAVRVYAAQGDANGPEPWHARWEAFARN